MDAYSWLCVHSDITWMLLKTCSPFPNPESKGLRGGCRLLSNWPAFIGRTCSLALALALALAPAAGAAAQRGGDCDPSIPLSGPAAPSRLDCCIICLGSTYCLYGAGWPKKMASIGRLKGISGRGWWSIDQLRNTRRLTRLESFDSTCKRISLFIAAACLGSSAVRCLSCDRRMTSRV